VLHSIARVERRPRPAYVSQGCGWSLTYGKTEFIGARGEVSNFSGRNSSAPFVRQTKVAMKLPTFLISGVLFLCHCATPAAPPVTDLKGEQEVLGQVKRRDALQAQFKDAPASARQRCELSAGDCRMEVTEGRDKVLKEHTTPQCRAASDSEAELKCVTGDLVGKGQANVATAYYRLETWCLEKLLACTAKLADDAVSAAQQAALDNRKERIEAARSGIAARALVTYADERIAYLRALLPVPGDSICSDQSGVERCQAKAKEASEQLTRELKKDDASYDEAKARSLYEASHAQLAECRTPEAECLTNKLDSYGGNAETRRYLADTLKSLSRRQELMVEVGVEASEACLNAGVQQYQSRIVQDYQRFAHEPVLFFQAQLHRDFRGLYDVQVGCLKSQIRPPRKAGNTRNAAVSSGGSREPG
jgi:hypothetical protein